MEETSTEKKADDASSTRQEMLQMGNNLVDLTD